VGLIDLTGREVGVWTVLGRAKNDKHRKAQWHCVCGCGQKRVIGSVALRNGGGVACVNCRDTAWIGMRFGRLTVTAVGKKTKDRRRCWECSCDCGGEALAAGYNLRRGVTRSCGCFGRDQTRKANRLEHGLAAFRCVLGKYQFGAKKRGLVWGLSKERFRELTSGGCHYCGLAPAQIQIPNGGANTGTYVYNGIDRVDNDKGYVEGNVVSCCTVCNKMKRTTSLKDFRTHITLLSNRSEEGRW
jgi:hypothetical protein